MRRLALVLVSLAIAAPAGAQIMRRGLSAQPTAVFSFGMARLSPFTVHDGKTSSTWQFGDATQITGSFEHVISPGISLGLSGSTARVPLTVSSTFGSGDADAQVSQAFATLYATGGNTLHTVLEGDIGATIYSGFTPRAGSAAVVPTGTSADFAYAIGYGFGYSFSPRFAIDFVQTIGTSMHSKEGLSAGTDSGSGLRSSRLVARFGLGAR